MRQIDIGGIKLNMYGLLIGIGIMVAMGVVNKVRENEKKKARVKIMDEEEMWRGLLGVMLGGIVGSRLYHVIDYWHYYRANLTEIWSIWKGGLGIYGGMIGGALVMLGYFRHKKVRYGVGLDLAAMGLPLGQAIGRWGNYVNQELYGKPTTWPWAIKIAPENRVAGMENFEYFHPLFLYESLWMLGVFGLISYLYWGRRKWKVGEGGFIGVYMIGYGLGRGILEGWRIEPWSVGGVPMAQIMSLLLIVVGLGLIGRANET